MKTKKIIKLVVASILVVCIFVSFFMIDLKVKSINNSSVTNSNNIGGRSSQLEKNLLQQTSLGRGNISNADGQIALKKNLKAMNKAQFFGAYVAINKNDITFSGQRGHANVNTGSSFKFDSTVLVGDYQEFLDDTILVKLIEKKKISPNVKLQKYIPGMKKEQGEMSVRDFLINGSNLFIKKSDISKVGSNSTTDFNLKYFKKGSIKSGDYVSADAILKVILISKINSTTYRKAFNTNIVEPLQLFNTRFYKKTKPQANDIKGYKYTKINETLNQENEVPSEKMYFATNELRMSTSDILISLNEIFSKGFFKNSSDELFDKIITQSGKRFSIKKNIFSLSEKVSGQYLSLKFNLKQKKMMIVIANFPNKNITIEEEMNSLYHILMLED